MLDWREDTMVQPDLWEGVRLRAGSKVARPHPPHKEQEEESGLQARCLGSMVCGCRGCFCLLG